MHDLPSQKLRELIAQYGRSLCDDPRRCGDLLKDHCGQYKREISLLVHALEYRVAAELINTSDSVPKSLLFGRLSRRLEEELAISAEAAQWAVESWALALGIVDADVDAREILKSKGIDCTVDAFLEKAGNGDTELIKVFIAAGIDVNAKGSEDNTALIFASISGHATTVQALITHGAQIEEKNNEGKTALMWAADNGHTETVQALLDRGAQIEATDNDGRTALMRAAGSGHTETVHALLDRGAQVEATDKYGRTALMWAAGSGHTETVHALLDRGAQIEATDKYGWTALRVAWKAGHKETVQLLKVYRDKLPKNMFKRIIEKLGDWLFHTIKLLF